MQVIIYTLIRNATLYIKLLTICSKKFDWDLYLKLLDYIVNRCVYFPFSKSDLHPSLFEIYLFPKKYYGS